MSVSPTCGAAQPCLDAHRGITITAPTDLNLIRLSCEKRTRSDRASFSGSDFIEPPPPNSAGSDAAAPTSRGRTVTSEDLLHLPQRASEFDAALHAKLDDIVARARRNPPDRIDIVSYVLVRVAIPAARQRAEATRNYLTAAGLDAARIHVDVRQIVKLREHGMGLAVRKGAEISLTYEAGPPQRPPWADVRAYTLSLKNVPLYQHDYSAATVSMLDGLADTLRACGSKRVDISTHATMFEEMDNPRAHAVKAYLVGRDVPADSIHVSGRSALRYGSSTGVMGRGTVIGISVAQEAAGDAVPSVRSRAKPQKLSQIVLPAYV